MKNPELLGAFLAIAILVAAIALFAFRSRKDSPRETELLQAGYRRTTRYYEGVEYRLQRGDTELFQRLREAGKSNPRRVSVGVPCATGADFVVTLEGKADRFWKRVGLATEVQTGDEVFDDGYYLAGRSGEFVAAVFREAAARRAVDNLFAMGMTEVVLEDGELTARKSGAEAGYLAVAAAAACADDLLRLRRAADAATAMVPVPRGLTGAQRNVAIAVATVTLMALGTVGSFLPHRLFEGRLAILWQTLPWGIGLAVACVAAYAMSLRGTSAGYKQFVNTALSLLVFVPFGAWGAFLLANEYLDGSVAVDHDVHVIGNATHSGKGVHYYLVLEAWPGLEDALEIEVPADVYRNTKRGSVWRVTTRSGRFGHEWLVEAHALGES